MKVKTEALSGAALDWAVAKAEGVEFTYETHPHHELLTYNYSTDWSQGGPIIERERLDIMYVPRQKSWISMSYQRKGAAYKSAHGPTLLIAAMRAYVLSCAGPEIEVPEDLHGARP